MDAEIARPETSKGIQNGASIEPVPVPVALPETPPRTTTAKKRPQVSGPSTPKISNLSKRNAKVDVESSSNDNALSNVRKRARANTGDSNVQSKNRSENKKAEYLSLQLVRDEESLSSCHEIDMCSCICFQNCDHDFALFRDDELVIEDFMESLDLSGRSNCNTEESYDEFYYEFF